MQVKDSKRNVFAHVCLDVHMFSVNVTDTIKCFYVYIQTIWCSSSFCASQKYNNKCKNFQQK